MEITCPACGQADWIVGDLDGDVLGVQFVCSCGHSWINSQWDSMHDLMVAYMEDRDNGKTDLS